MIDIETTSETSQGDGVVRSWRGSIGLLIVGVALLLAPLAIGLPNANLTLGAKILCLTVGTVFIGLSATLALVTVPAGRIARIFKHASSLD